MYGIDASASTEHRKRCWTWSERSEREHNERRHGCTHQFQFDFDFGRVQFAFRQCSTSFRCLRVQSFWEIGFVVTVVSYDYFFSPVLEAKAVLLSHSRLEIGEDTVRSKYYTETNENTTIFFFELALCVCVAQWLWLSFAIVFDFLKPIWYDFFCCCCFFFSSSFSFSLVSFGVLCADVNVFRAIKYLRSQCQ